jgi:multiple sugar transport system permease protein
MYVYLSGFQNFRMGYASALAFVLFVIVLIFTLIQKNLSNRWVHY